MPEQRDRKDRVAAWYLVDDRAAFDGLEAAAAARGVDLDWVASPEALARRLAEPRPPDLVLVETSGCFAGAEWLAVRRAAPGATTDHGVRGRAVPVVAISPGEASTSGGATEKGREDVLLVARRADAVGLLRACATAASRFADALATETITLDGESERFAGTMTERLDAVGFYRGAADRLGRGGT